MIVVDREYRADMLHGRTPIGDIVSTINEGLEAHAADGQGLAARRRGIDGRLLFLDLETTGLFGGAGTQAFLVGCASIEGISIRVRQFLLPGFEHERAVLSEFQAWAKAHGTLCTYNGRSFDVPLIETRFMFHRVPCPLDGVPHLDMLHAARRLWRQRPLTSGTPDPDDSSCSLAVLEKHIAGLHRVGDVPGYEIPSRFFKFVRSGDAASARSGDGAQPPRPDLTGRGPGARDHADHVTDLAWRERRRKPTGWRGSMSAPARTTTPKRRC